MTEPIAKQDLSLSEDEFVVDLRNELVTFFENNRGVVFSLSQLEFTFEVEFLANRDVFVLAMWDLIKTDAVSVVRDENNEMAFKLGYGS
jgi:hypothetical protein